MTQSHDHEFRKGGFRPPDQPVALLKGVSRGHFYAQLNAAPEACFLGLRGSTPRNNFLYLIRRFITTTSPTATLSSSTAFPVWPVIRSTLLRRFLGGTRRVSPVASHVLVTVLSHYTPPR
jgi:hypothetical protein